MDNLKRTRESGSGNYLIRSLYGRQLFISIMSFSFAPFEASYHLSRVFYAIALGLFYGACFEKAGSMYYPMIMHSFTNVMMMGVSIILSIIL